MRTLRSAKTVFYGSGGVASIVAAALIHRVIDDQLHARRSNERHDGRPDLIHILRCHRSVEPHEDSPHPPHCRRRGNDGETNYEVCASINARAAFAIAAIGPELCSYVSRV